jgi:endonuclease/exonuclease/phosphatase family metal-dependent hydrolase
VRWTKSQSRSTYSLLLPVALLSSACAGVVDLEVDTRPRPCIGTSAPITWLTPADDDHRRKLDAWCTTVGTPVVLPSEPQPTPVTRLAIVTWNVHVGAGDLVALVRDLRSGAFTSGDTDLPLVLLLQEAYRSDGDVPLIVAPDNPVPSRIAPAGRTGVRTSTLELGARLGLGATYVPSMRNGRGDQRSREDRGVAILSTLPLTDVQAIELPFERQRRVVVAARVGGLADGCDSTELWVLSVHLENRSGKRRLWLESPRARASQTKSLLRYLQSKRTVVLGGDLNTWATREPALDLLREELPAAVAPDRRPTHLSGRIDDLFARLPAGWVLTTRRLDSRYDSDHFPVLGLLELRPSEPSRAVTPVHGMKTQPQRTGPPESRSVRNMPCSHPLAEVRDGEAEFGRDLRAPGMHL